MPTILIVDDESHIRDLIREILAFAGLEALTAGDGEAGLALAIEQEPDLILCDVSMPKLNGFGMLEAVRAHRPLEHTPFIFLTGHSDRATMRKGMELGADDYITKPFKPDEILSAITIRLERLKKLKALQGSGDGLSTSILDVLPHELNTPLQKILGFSDILREDVEDLLPQDIARTAELIHKAAQRLHRLTENFLSFAQLERLANDPAMASQLLDATQDQVKAIISATVQARIKHYGRQKDLTLQLEDDVVHVNETHLCKMVEEVIDNACKFSEPGTPIEVLSQAYDENRYVLQITDAGRGMSPEAISQIGAFRQFDRHLYEQQGMGLGLALSVRLADLHGGTIKIHAEEDGGTTVSFILRRAQ